MSRVKETTKEINKWVDGITDLADVLLSPTEEADVIRAEKELKTCRMICRIVKIIVLTICAIIVYFHVKG